MALDSAGDTSLLLGSGDVPPVVEHNAAGRSPFLLTCDHYGRAIPAILGDLGLPAAELARHIAWDPGIAGVADALSKHLGAHLIAQRYSRLVIDCNRPSDALSSIPRISEATVIPGNEGLTRDAAEARRRAGFVKSGTRDPPGPDRRRGRQATRGGGAAARFGRIQTPVGGEGAVNAAPAALTGRGSMSARRRRRS